MADPGNPAPETDTVPDVNGQNGADEDTSNTPEVERGNIMPVGSFNTMLSTFISTGHNCRSVGC